MLRRILKGALVGSALAASGVALAAEPEVLSLEALDSVSAGRWTGYLSEVPTSAAFAYAFTTASTTPGMGVIVNVAYEGGGGANQSVRSNFSQSIIFTR